VAPYVPRVAGSLEPLGWRRGCGVSFAASGTTWESSQLASGIQSAVIACGRLLLLFCQLKPIRLWVNLISKVAVLLCKMLASLAERRLTLREKGGVKGTGHLFTVVLVPASREESQRGGSNE
jgi:hypothetical protein